MTARDSHVDTVTRDAIETSNATPAEASAAQRQRVYRMRRKRAAIDAVGSESQASRVTLVSMLAQDLAALESGSTTPQKMIPAHRSSAKRILNVIVTRYGLEP